jgi:hypothetical protein
MLYHSNTRSHHSLKGGYNQFKEPGHTLLEKMDGNGVYGGERGKIPGKPHIFQWPELNKLNR